MAQKVYKAVVSQSGGDDPVATVFKNTFGIASSWNNGASLTMMGAFTGVVYIQATVNGEDATHYIPWCFRINDNQISVNVIDTEGISWTDWTISIEIIVK